MSSLGMAASSARLLEGGLAPAAAGPGGAGWGEERGGGSDRSSRAPSDITLPGGREEGAAGAGDKEPSPS